MLDWQFMQPWASLIYPQSPKDYAIVPHVIVVVLNSNQLKTTLKYKNSCIQVVNQTQKRHLDMFAEK